MIGQGFYYVLHFYQIYKYISLFTSQVLSMYIIPAFNLLFKVFMGFLREQMSEPVYLYLLHIPFLGSVFSCLLFLILLLILFYIILFVLLSLKIMFVF